MKTDTFFSTTTLQFDAADDSEHGLNEPGLLGYGLLGSEPKSVNRSLPARKLCPEFGSDPKNPSAVPAGAPLRVAAKLRSDPKNPTQFDATVAVAKG